MVPPSANKYLVVDSGTYSALRQIPGSASSIAREMRGSGVDRRQFGKMKDFYIFRSQFVPMTGSAPAATHNLAFTRDGWFGCAASATTASGTGAIAEYAEVGNFGMRVIMSYQPNTLAQQFTVDVLYGTGVLRNSFGVQVNC